MNRTLVLFMALIIICTSISLADDKNLIKTVIEDSYFKPAYITGDSQAMMSGWDNDSLMVISDGERISKYKISKWAESFKTRKPKDKETTFSIAFIEVEDYAATAKVEISQHGKIVYSDYLSLYKFKSGWKLVAKTFFQHKEKPATNTDNEIELVKNMISESYVKAMFLTGDIELVKKGWHENCDICVYYPQNDSIRRNPVAGLIPYIQRKGPLAPGTTHKFGRVDIVGDAAFARVEVFTKGKHIYSDMMHLYKFKDGWKVATKIYYSW